MRVALVAPLYETVPPKAYGGTERVVAGLADELVRLGHDVTLFAANGSRTAAHLVPAAPGPLRMSMTRQEMVDVAPHLHLQMLSDVCRVAHQFDIVHAHTDIWTLPFVRLSPVPMLITVHGRLDLDVVQRIFPLYLDTPLVSVSDAQRVHLDHFPVQWVGTCYNGLRLEHYLTAERGAGDYLAFVGRLTPEKRPDLAVEIADRVGLPLRVAAKVDPIDEDYWRDVVRPLFARHDVDFLGELSEPDKPAFYAGARATLFPIDWPEPFGLVMVESLAAGTPVVALRRGSVPEIVEHGVTGEICDDVDQVVAAVGRCDRYTAAACRRRAEMFSAEAMTRRYVDLYQRVVEQRRQIPSDGSGLEDGRPTASR
jgi:glycosyltransferase involved in cell wall biosynthesis